MTGLSSFENAAHLLDELIAFHQYMADFYQRARPDADPLGALFLEQLAEREQKLADALERYEELAPLSVLKTWIQVSFIEDPEKFLAALEQQRSATLTPLEIYEMANGVDEFINRLLQHVKDSCSSSEVEKLAEDLLEGERIEQIALSKAYNSLREM